MVWDPGSSIALLIIIKLQSGSWAQTEADFHLLF